MVYKISGPSLVHTVAASAQNDVLPPDEGIVGKTPRWVHVEVVSSITAYVRTGLVGETVATAGAGMPVQLNTNGKVLRVSPGHTHIQSFGSGDGSLVVTPLSGDPRS